MHITLTRSQQPSVPEKDKVPVLPPTALEVQVCLHNLMKGRSNKSGCRANRILARVLNEPLHSSFCCAHRVTRHLAPQGALLE